MTDVEEKAPLDHCVLHIATYAKDPLVPKQKYPDTVWHVPICASLVHFREDDTGIAVNAQNFLIKDPAAETKLVKKLVAAFEDIDPLFLVTFFGHGFTLPVLYYRCFIHGIGAPILFDPEDGFYPRQSPRHLELTGVFTNHGSITARKMNDYAVRMLGLPSRPRYEHDKVVALADEGKWGQIKGNLAVDVFSISLLFLRHAVVVGLVPEDQEDEVTASLISACGRSKAVRAFANEVFEDSDGTTS
jgi:DNA polymerase elongation subunit (family B)